MISLLDTPAFNSCLFESSNFRATLRTWSLFHLSFCIPGWLEVSHIHVINPGNHFVTVMKKTSSREGFPNAVNLVNHPGDQCDENPELWMTRVGGHTLGLCKIWPTGYPSRPRFQSRIQKLQHRPFER